MIYSTEKGNNYIKYTFKQVKTRITNIASQLFDYETHINDSVIITLENNAVITLGHAQNCCEEVTLTDGLNELRELAGSELLYIEITSEMRDGDEYSFVKVQTNKDSANLRWVGYSANYSTEVDMFVNDEDVSTTIKGQMNRFTIG